MQLKPERPSVDVVLALEPAVGDGAIVCALAPYCMSWMVCDIRDAAGLYLVKAHHATVADYLKEPNAGRIAAGGSAKGFDLAITNPPFSLVLPFAQKMCNEASWVALLTREAWRGGNAEGRAWLRQHQPDIYRLPNRPSFAASITCTNRKLCGYKLMCALDAPWANRCPDCGAKCIRTTSDSAEYAWLVWGPHSHEGRPGAVSLLAETPKAERKVTPAQ